MSNGIFLDDHAAVNVNAGYVGKPYQPSNGFEGDIFMESYCQRCEHEQRAGSEDVEGCQIICASMVFNPGEEGYPGEWIYNEEGQPTCTAFTPIESV